jgi:hypothetical protein
MAIGWIGCVTAALGVAGAKRRGSAVIDGSETPVSGAAAEVREALRRFFL